VFLTGALTTLPSTYPADSSCVVDPDPNGKSNPDLDYHHSEKTVPDLHKSQGDVENHCGVMESHPEAMEAHQ
jgi:hypothetical protein